MSKAKPSKMKEYNFNRGNCGAVVPASKGRTRITIRIDDDVLEWFRGEVEAAGPWRKFYVGSYEKN